MKQAIIKKQFWRDISAKVANLNPKLAKIINEIDPGYDFPVYIARYPYGSVIVKNGVFHIPYADGQIIPINDTKVDNCIQNDLTYRGIGLPAGMVLEHTIHEAVTTCQQLLPLGVVTPGSVFALWKKLDKEEAYHPINMFTITSGARFIFMVPNISNLEYHRNLKRDFNLRLPPPGNLIDQWELFKAIINSPSNHCNWSSELLFFSKNWFEKICTDSAWNNLYLCLLETAWQKSAYDRNNMFYRLAFSRVQSSRNLKPDPYLVDTVKHLFMMAAGVLPGFAPAIDDMCAPNTFIQKVYVQSYGLKYSPTIFLPTHFTIDDNSRPIYYSMHLPTMLEFSPKSRQISSTASKLRELKYVTDIFTTEIKQNKLNIENTIVCKIAEEVKFDFFHSKPDHLTEIRLTSDMVDEDPSLLCCTEILPIKKFSDSGAAVRGCVRIASKKYLSSIKAQENESK